MSKEKEVLENEKVSEIESETAEANEVSKEEKQETIIAEPNLEELLEIEKDKYIRLLAEFDNFKKRNIKERIELISSASKDVILDIIPVLDDFDRALQALSKKEEENKTQIEGIKLISSKLEGILSKKGLKLLDCLHQEFDADRHEAIANIPATEDNLKGKVVDVVEKGYTLNDKVIRFAKVVVAN